MRVINIVEQGSVIKKKDIRFLIYKEGVLNEYIPYFKVDRFILWGNQNVTSGALNLAFEKGIDFIFLTQSGKFKGKTQGKNSKNIYARLAQYVLWREKDNKLKLAKIIIKSKINNQVLFLKNYKITLNVEDILLKIPFVKDIHELMGLEGIASKRYFDKFPLVISNSKFEFNGRNRRPPKDEVNGMLSLTYSMTLNYIIVALEKAGLDPFLGFLHSTKYGREALALDLLEEFRQGFCDKFVIKMINRREVKKSDFFKSEELGVRFTEIAFRKYLKKFLNESEVLERNIDAQVKNLYDYILLCKEYKPLIFNNQIARTCKDN